MPVKRKSKTPPPSGRTMLLHGLLKMANQSDVISKSDSAKLKKVAKLRDKMR